MIVRRLIFMFGLILVLGVTLYRSAELEMAALKGRQVVLELNPLYRIRMSMRGDYMDLEYDVERYLKREAGNNGSYNEKDVHVLDDPERYNAGEYNALRADNGSGRLALEEGEDGVSRFSRLLRPGEEAAKDEIVIFFPDTGDAEYKAMRRFYFRESDVTRFHEVKYGVLRVDEEGRAVLVDVLGEDRKPLSGKALE